MKLKNILFLVLFISSQYICKAQVSGTANIFETNELNISYYHDINKISDSKYLFTLIPLLNEDAYLKPVQWSSNNPSLATIDENGVAKILQFSNTPVVFTAKGVEDPNLAATFSVNISASNIYEELFSIEIISASSIKERTPIPITAIVFPSGRRDVDAVFTVNDPSIARIENGTIIPLKDGEITVNVVSSVDNTITNTKNIVIANVTDVKSPTLCIQNYVGESTINLQRGVSTEIPSAIGKDDIDGDVEVTITETGTSFNGNVFGDYPVRYYAKDAQNNETQIDVVLTVRDTIAPTISFKDSDITLGATIEALQGEGLTIPEVTAVDDNGDEIAVVIEDNGFDPDVIGTYEIAYTATDPSNNVGENNLTLVINLGAPPVITLSDGYKENDVIIIKQNEVITIPTATAIDALNNQLSLEIDDGGFNNTIIGDYPITYTAEDRFGNQHSIQITIRVEDGIAPVITNKSEIKSVQRTLESTATYVTKVEATDNVAVTSYSITEVGENEAIFNQPPRDDEHYEYLTESGGTITIDNSGTITATGSGFEAQFYFKIIASDALNNKDSTYVALSNYRIQPPDIQVKELEKADWIQIGFNNLLSHSTTKQTTTPVNSKILFINALGRGDHTLDRYELSGTGSSDFELVTDSSNASTTILTLKNAFDSSRQSSYTLTVDIFAQLNPTDPIIKLTSIYISISLKSVEQISPAITDLKDLLGAGVEFTLRNLFEATGLPKPTTQVLGPEIGSVLDAYLLGLPIIDQGIDAIGAKNLIKLSPYAFWVTLEPNITRIFVKFQKGPKKSPISYQIEFVIDKNKNGAYWIMNLGSGKRGAGLRPSQIHSSLQFLDHGEGSIVYTNTTINKSNFKCLPLASELNLKAGIHLVAQGNLFPGATNGFVNPRVGFRIGVTEAGWTVPDLVTTIQLETDFLAAFDKEIIDFLFSASDLARKGITEAADAINIAANNVHHGEYVFNQVKAQIASIERGIRKPQQYVNYLQGRLNSLNSAISSATNKINDLSNDEICTPGCWLPIYRPGWCSCGKFCPGYPCPVFVTCTGFEICVPDPVSMAQIPGYAIYLASLEGTRLSILAALTTANAVLEAAKLPLIAANETLEQSKISLEALRLVLLGLEESLRQIEAGYGKLGEIARYFIDKLPKPVESSNAIFETTLAVANSGTISGKLGFDFKFQGAPAIKKEIDFNFSNPAGSILNFAETLIK